MSILCLILLMAVAGYGAATILIDSKLFSALHSLLDWLVWETHGILGVGPAFAWLQNSTQCYMCVGFWCSAVFAHWYGLILQEVVMSGCIGAVLSEHAHDWYCKRFGPC